MKPKTKFGRIEQVIDGKSYRHRIRKDGSAVIYTVCCDCQLVHIERYKPEGKYLEVTVWRDNVKTDTLRKKDK